MKKILYLLLFLAICIVIGCSSPEKKSESTTTLTPDGTIIHQSTTIVEE